MEAGRGGHCWGGSDIGYMFDYASSVFCVGSSDIKQPDLKMGNEKTTSLSPLGYSKLSSLPIAIFVYLLARSLSTFDTEEYLANVIIMWLPLSYHIYKTNGITLLPGIRNCRDHDKTQRSVLKIKQTI
jgi:hypothetical protein